MALTLDNLRQAAEAMMGETPQAQAAPKKKKPRKVKIDSSEEGVANALTGFLQDKEKQIKKKLDTKNKEKEDVEKKIKDLIRKARTLETTTGNLAKKYEDTVNKQRSEVVDDYRKLITKIKLLDFIETFEVDDRKRILFTTTPISVQKKTWKKEKVAGRYQVRIDFKRGSIKEGIQAINIDQHYKEYDHPNLSRSFFCYGSKLAIDVEEEYREQDLYELVIDLVDLLRSPNDQDGFTRWGYFFRGAKKRPKDYSFAKYDEEDHENGVEFGFPPFQEGPGTFWNTTYSNLTDAMTVHANTAYTAYYGASAPQRFGPPDNEKEAIAVHLLRLGFLDLRTATYYADRILHRTHGSAPTSIDLRRLESGEGAELFFNYREGIPMVAMTATEAATEPSSRDMVERMLVPANLLRPEGAQMDIREIDRMERELREQRMRMEDEMMRQQQMAMQSTASINDLRMGLNYTEEENKDE